MANTSPADAASIGDKVCMGYHEEAVTAIRGSVLGNNFSDMVNVRTAI